jgi:hypothetical protein
MEEPGLARSTIGRRLSTVAGFNRFAVIDGLIEHSPAEYIRRPKIDTSRPPWAWTGWSSKLAVIPLPTRVARVADPAAGDRLGGPLLLTRVGNRITGTRPPGSCAGWPDGRCDKTH